MKLQRLSNLLVCGHAALILTACGGGSGDLQSRQFPNAASYLGTWLGSCGSDNAQTTLQVTLSGNLISMSGTTNYYGQPNCGGAALATSTLSLPTSASYIKTESSSVILPPANSASNISIDQAGISRPVTYSIVTGNTVYDRTTNNIHQRCFDKSQFDTICVNTDPQSAISFTGGFYVSGSNIYIMQFSNGLYTSASSGVYTKI